MFSRRTNWPLAPNRFTEVLEHARHSGAPVFDLTVSNPTRAGLVFDETAILDSLRNRNALDYDPHPKGLLMAREALAAYYAQRGVSIDVESLILTTGTSEGYSFLFRLLANPGDEILVAKPSYPLFDFLADLDDLKLVPYPMLYDHGWQIDFHTLEQAINERTRVIVLVHPNNPTGSYVGDEERERLHVLCAQHDLALIVDEVFLDYAHDGARRRSFAGNGGVLTFTLSGVSKISALPQMKLAWIAVSGPPNLRSEALNRLEVIADTYLSVSTPVQWAAPDLLAQSKKTQPQICARVRENLAQLDRQLAKQSICSRLRVEGGWYAVLRVPAAEPDEELAIRLLQDRRTIVHPGHFYDFSQDGYLVLSLIAPSDAFQEGTERILAHFAS